MPSFVSATARVLTALALLVAIPDSGGAQVGADRAVIDSVLDELRAKTPPAPGRCAPYQSSLQLLCQSMVAAKRAELTMDKAEADRAERDARQVVLAKPEWALGWYAIGVARLQMAHTGMVTREGPLHPVGATLETGAGNAMERALELEPSLRIAAEALALIGVPRDGASQLTNRVAVLRRVRPMLSPLALLGAAQVERMLGSRDSAAALLEAAIVTRGVDDGVAKLELARELHSLGRSDEGRKLLFAGAGVDSPAAFAGYRHELEWVAEPAELAAWDSTAAADRSAWLERFWSERDVAAGWSEGERLKEHYRRVEHAWKNFTLIVPVSGRQKLRSRTGGIDTYVDELLVREATSANAVDAEFNREGTTEATRLDAARANSMATAQRLAGLDGPFQAFRTSQTALDDRGVVWIRHGAPSRVATSVGGEALALWVYDRGDAAMTLQFREQNFDGQSGATSLVPTLIDVPARYRDQFCSLEVSLCSTENTVRGDEMMVTMTGGGRSRVGGGTRAVTEGGRITTALVGNLVERGEAMIAHATATDAHPREFTARVTPAVQLYGLDRPGEGARAVTAFAIPGDQLAYTQPPEAGGRTVYTIRMQLSAIDAAGQRRDLDTLRRFAVAAPLTKGQLLQGSLEMVLPGGRHTMALVLTQDDGRGAVSSLGAIPVPMGGGRLGISSLVLGREGSGIAWRSGTTTVPLNPVNSYARGSDATLYYQLTGLKTGERYQTRVEFIEAARTDDRPALSLTFADEAPGTRMEVLREVGLKNLDPGRFRVRVTVSGGDASTSETAWLTVVKQ
ncbi:MAG: GWxTD domain-containing protein [Gemmatimonadales bacterium]|nr:GWxTD domain-containing protein [Gemmatimonadales bacterium]MDZ4389945.1 GWxTD domain-containing protein [Gemmatimonadales bacterium]